MLVSSRQKYVDYCKPYCEAMSMQIQFFLIKMKWVYVNKCSFPELYHKNNSLKYLSLISSNVTELEAILLM